MKVSINISSDFSLLLLVAVIYDVFKHRNLDIIVDFEGGESDVEFLPFKEFLYKATTQDQIYAARIMSKSNHQVADLNNEDFLLTEDLMQVEIDDTHDNIDLISNQMFDSMIKELKDADYIVSCFKRKISPSQIKEFHFALNEAAIITSKMSVHDKINLINLNAITNKETLNHLSSLNYTASSPITMDNYKRAKQQIGLTEKLDFNKIIVK